MENAYIAKATDLTAVADAIRTRGETSEPLVFPDGFVTAIENIQTGSTRPNFAYDGDFEVIDDGKTFGVQNWRIRFTTSGTLTLEEDTLIDVFLVGGGGGSSATADSAYPSGGGGGYTNTARGVTATANTPYVIEIGAGGEGGGSKSSGSAGGTSSAFGHSASGGNGGGYSSERGGDGGTGGNGYGVANPQKTDGEDGYAGRKAGGTGQKTTTREFGDAEGKLYASGGCNDGSVFDAPPNTGDGGSGKGSDHVGYDGGSGIVIIRNAR